MNGGAPLVSVVTCFLNAGQFLEETIQSVLAQTHDSWELLLVDDGSNDGSTEIARRYASELPGRIRYFEHPGHLNAGCSASRNLALRHARGEYVAVLDADDVFLPQALEKRVAVLQSRPEIGMVYGPALLWHGWTGDSNDQRRDREERLHVAPGTVFSPLAYSAYLLDYDADIPSPCTLLIRRGAIDQAGGFDDAFRDLFDDQVLYIKISLKTAVLVSGDCDSKYRQHAGSTCAVADRAGRTDAARLVYLDWVKRYLGEQGVRDDRVWKAFEAIHERFHRPRRFRLLQIARRLVNRLTGS
jgi:glycosyltransferase involved in cell wall biosynthesis